MSVVEPHPVCGVLWQATLAKTLSLTCNYPQAQGPTHLILKIAFALPSNLNRPVHWRALSGSWPSWASHEHSVEACGKELASGGQTPLVGIRGSWATTLFHTEFAEISVIFLSLAEKQAPFSHAWSEVKMHVSFLPTEAFVTLWSSVHSVPFWPQHSNRLRNLWFCRRAVFLLLTVLVEATFSCSGLHPKQARHWSPERFSQLLPCPCV